MVTKPKGHPKTGGRPKGTAFKDCIKAILQEKGIDIVGTLIKDLGLIEDDAKRAELTLKFMEFIYPKARQEIGIDFKNAGPEQLLPYVSQIIERIESVASVTDTQKVLLPIPQEIDQS